MKFFNLCIPVLAILLALLNSLQANAAGEDGTRGGENAVVCFNNPAIPLAIRDVSSPRYGQILDEEVKNNVVSVESYDLFEARMPRGLDHVEPKIIAFAEGENIRSYVERIAKRFSAFIPVISASIRRGSDTFNENHILIRPGGLKRVHDENDVGYIDASRCVVATMAVQYEAGNDTYLQIDSRLYYHPTHSHLSQAVLFLHEALYYVARSNGQRDSRNTRLAVGSLINAAPINSKELRVLWESLGFPSSLDNAGDSYLVSFLAPVLRKYVNDQIKPMVRRSDTGRRLIGRFKSWEQIFWKISFSAPSYGAISTYYDARNDICMTLRVGDGRPFRIPPPWTEAKIRACDQEITAIYQSLPGVQKNLLVSAQQELNRILAQSVFPQLDRLPQLQGDSREKAKEILKQAVRTSKVEEPELNQGVTPAFDFQFSAQYDWESAMKQVVMVIP